MSPGQRKLTFVLAGGGTGGHVFPLLAVGEALRSLAEVEIVFVGTPRGLESRFLPPRGEKLELLDIEPILGGGASRAVRGAIKAARALPAADRLLAELRPRAVVAAGGYAAGPIGLAASLRRVPLAVLEPNSMFGLANRWLLPFARRAYVAFDETEQRAGTIAVRTGVPLRGAFTARPYELPTEQVRVLVLGGSQGARALNERLPSAFAMVRREVPNLVITHQAGRDREEAVRALYRDQGAESWVRVVPFIDDVASALADAHLVVSRSGAGAVAELCAVGRPGLLIPFPHAAEQHQERNADALARAGAAVWIREAEATSERLASALVGLARAPARLEVMAQRSRSVGRPGAAVDIARDLLEWVAPGVLGGPTTAGGRETRCHDVSG